MKAHSATADRIMDAAQQMVQTCGYNAFSYGDIAAQVGIRKASIHYHFPSKGDLGKELVTRYRLTFSDKLNQIDQGINDCWCKLEAYAQLYLDALLDNDRMCLCGMLASDIATLPEQVSTELKKFFADNETWLTKVLSDGRKAKALSFNGPATVAAQLLLSGLQGAMLLSRTNSDIKLFRTMARELLARLKA